MTCSHGLCDRRYPPSLHSTLVNCVIETLRGSIESNLEGNHEQIFLHDFEKQLETLTRAEKAQLLQWVVCVPGGCLPRD